MRRFRSIIALLLALLLCGTAAMAEVPFLRIAQDWTLEDVPLEVMLSADVKAHMPYDEDRLAMLKAVTDKLSLRLTAGENAGSVSILAGQSNALTLSYRGEETQLSCMPGVTFLSSEGAAEKLLGADTGDISLYGIRGDAETLLDDGWVLLNALGNELEKYADRRNVKTYITDMGTARSCTDYTIPKDDAEALKETLLRLTPEGWLKEIITSLTFSGRQNLRVYRTAEEIPLRMEYNGTCGPEGNLRTVKLVWRMRRDDTAHRDEITLTSPAKSGGNKNTLEFERVIQKNKTGAIELEGSFTYTVTLDKQMTTRKGEFTLENAFTDEADVLTGSLKLQQKLPGENSFSGLQLEPQLTLSGEPDAPVISGSVLVTGLKGKNVLEQADVHIYLSRCDTPAWQESEWVIDLDQLSEEELVQLRQDAAASIATAVVKPLIILMGADAEWFFRDMPPEAVQKIIDASNAVVLE